jgi:hypothetical protein
MREERAEVRAVWQAHAAWKEPGLDPAEQARRKGVYDALYRRVYPFSEGQPPGSAAEAIVGGFLASLFALAVMLGGLVVVIWLIKTIWRLV